MYSTASTPLQLRSYRHEASMDFQDDNCGLKNYRRRKEGSDINLRGIIVVRWSPLGPAAKLSCERLRHADDRHFGVVPRSFPRSPFGSTCPGEYKKDENSAFLYFFAIIKALANLAFCYKTLEYFNTSTPAATLQIFAYQTLTNTTQCRLQ